MYTKQLSVYLKNTDKEYNKRVSCKINVHRAVNSAFSNAESAFSLPPSFLKFPAFSGMGVQFISFTIHPFCAWGTFIVIF